MTAARDRQSICVFLMASCLAIPGAAQAPAANAGAPPAPAEESLAIEQLRKRTAQIQDLIDGRLDGAVDPATLLAVDLSVSRAGSDLDRLLQELDRGAEPSGRQKGRRRPADSESALERARRELVEARAAFLALPAEKREEILSSHEARRREVAAKRASKRLKAELLAELQSQANQLEAFLRGELDPSADPRPLLEIDLADLGDLASSPRRRQRFLDPDAAKETPAEPPGGDLDAQLDAARQRRDSLWRQFLALDEETRSALFESHVERGRPTSEELLEQITEAEQAAQEAAAQREQALADLQLAQTEALRLIADRRARLLTLKEAQARFEAELASRRSEIEAAMEAALAWNRRVRELEEALPPGVARANEADGLYKMLIQDLGEARRNLSLALDAVTSEPSGVPRPPEAERDPISADVDDETIRELRTELASTALKLEAAETQLRWDRATAFRDAIVIMNKSRLRLFSMLSEPRRDRLEGFGPEGVAQVKREIKQIMLEVRFQLLSLPREATRRYQLLRSAPGPAFAGLFQLVLLVVVFRWWRRRADSTLEQVRRNWLQKRPQTQFTRGVSTFAWYLRRVRKPLEWFAFLTLLIWLIAKAGQLAGAEYFEIIIVWLLAGAFVVELLDATASRQGVSTESSAKLRFRSLRMVGVSVVAVGLILSLTVATVGKGAIYAWVVSTFWFLAIPIFLVLVFWWKDTIFERAKVRESSGLLRWVAAHEKGVLKYPAAAIGGVYLLIEGVTGFFVRRISDLAPLRRFFAYLFRRGVEKSASAKAAEYGTEPLPAELYEALAPRPTVPPELVTSYMTKQVHAMRALVRSDKHAIVAVVGERGLGKSTFLKRVTSDAEPGDLCSVQCQPGGFSRLLREFARALELSESATEEQIIASLRERAPSMICVDDAQRLVRPLIGGLEDIDHLIRFTRLVNPQSSWLIAIGMPAWQYLRRARGDRAAFDQIIELDRWEEAQIATLIEQRTAAAGVVPSFERLVVPRQVQTSPVSDEERTKRDFYRILWDYSDGNPEVALHFWRESLYRRPPDETVHVRLFSGPTAGQLDELPSTFYFVLRTVVQLELAVEEDIVTCTDLAAAEVADALRAARVNGYVRERDHLFEIDIHWYRAITSILRRKHLLLL